MAPSRGLSVVATLEEIAQGAPAAFVARLGASLQYPVAGIHDLHRWHPAFDVLPFTEALKAQVLPMWDAGSLRLVLGDPFSFGRIAWAEERIGAPFTWTLAHHGDVAAYLARHEEGLSAMASLVPDAPSRGSQDIDVEDLSFQSITQDTSQVVRLVRSTLYDALKAHASDIHLETTPAGLSIRYRLDGVLVSIGQAHGQEVAEQAISRLKVMAELDISERRVPQDGRFTVSVQGREIDFRVSIMPSIFGEDAVLRILDKQRLADAVRGLTLDSLGFEERDRVLIRRFASEPYGMLLVTGPTGSGKTTTLYAALSETSTGHDKVITIEDPVEYQLPGVLQIPVNERKGLTFARGLRSILRHDPDRVMVGEIRDPETAQIAVQAALTGHLVFTTVHANNVFDVLGRFTHMEVDPYSFAAALTGIVAQRLVRLNCPHCSEPVTPTEEQLQSSLLTGDTSGFRFMAGSGCGQCRSTGHLGRTAIAEIMVMNDELREMIVAREPIRALKEVARRGGTRFLREAALELVRTGRTSLEEINRVTFVA
ncbi:type II/IV secretion system protein [Ramlibacter henchirensis]|uniref:Type II/IV secretion system protein n=1 Tax=Ramlibacter henchirensis TaxID=204072 RepID=A0A4Z0C6Z2_9BURK|nr:GspE/PulE family protein [Ramlibacter henchirensis]TFZ07436.1 type II/IV secretion system protein [Ramlibacter henchirensis]